MFGFHIDEVYDDLFTEIEKVQDGVYSHHIGVKAIDKKSAAIELANRLVDFFYENMYELDSNGLKFNK